MVNYSVLPLEDFAGGDYDLHTLDLPERNPNADGTSNTKQEHRLFRISRNNMVNINNGLTSFGDSRTIKTLFADDIKNDIRFASRGDAIEAVSNNFDTIDTIHRVQYSSNVDGKTEKRWLYAAVTRNPQRLAQNKAQNSESLKAMISIHRGEGAKPFGFDLKLVARLKVLLAEIYSGAGMSFQINDSKALTVTIEADVSAKEELFIATHKFVSSFAMKMAMSDKNYTNIGALVRYE